MSFTLRFRMSREKKRTLYSAPTYFLSRKLEERRNKTKDLRIRSPTSPINTENSSAHPLRKSFLFIPKAHKENGVLWKGSPFSSSALVQLKIPRELRG